MRILKISDVYFPRINGVSRSIETFRDDFLKHGHDVCLVAPRYPGQTNDQGDIIRVDARRVPFDPEDRLMKKGHLRAASAELLHDNFDIVHIHTPFIAHYEGLRMAARLGVPAVETYHTFFEEYFDSYIPWLPKGILKLAARRLSATQCNALDGLIVPSGPMRDVLIDYGIKTPMSVIPTGIDMKQLTGGDGVAFRRKHGIHSDRPTLVHVGRVAHEKNIDFVLRVVARVKETIPDILLILAGEGPALGHLKQLASRLDIEANVLFLGYLDRASELVDCYTAGDVFTFASRTETQGLVLLEAMATGLPVVSTAVMGTKDVLREGEGALIAEDDLGHFSAQVLRVLQDSSLRASLSEKARVYANTWSSEALSERMLAYYEEIIDRASDQL